MRDARITEEAAAFFAALLDQLDQNPTQTDSEDTEATTADDLMAAIAADTERNHP